jgi:predicted membrane-bound spermidine synthase
MAMRYSEAAPNNTLNILTDDRPYLHISTFNTVNRIYTNIGVLTIQNVIAVFSVISILSGILLCASSLYFYKYVALRPRDIVFPFYAIATSAGLAVFENIFLQKSSLLLGNPILVYAVILPFTLICMGIGNLLFARVTARTAFRLAIMMAAVMGIYYIFVNPITALMLPLAFAVKLCILAGLIIPPGLLAGMFFPLGLGAAGKRNTMYVPWIWGIDTLAFMVWCFVIWFIMFTFGIKTSIVLGIIGYLGAAVAIRYFDL